MSLILNKSQAESVYSAMCALNNVGGVFFRTAFDMSTFKVEVMDCADLEVIVTQSPKLEHASRINGTRREIYKDQAAFATAYGLDDGGGYQSAVAAAAGGLTQTAIER